MKQVKLRSMLLAALVAVLAAVEVTMRNSTLTKSPLMMASR